LSEEGWYGGDDLCARQVFDVPLVQPYSPLWMHISSGCHHHLGRTRKENHPRCPRRKQGYRTLWFYPSLEYSRSRVSVSLFLTLFAGRRGRCGPSISSTQSRDSNGIRPKRFLFLATHTRVLPYPPIRKAGCTAADHGVVPQDHVLGVDPMERWQGVRDRVDLNLGL
jgi:hypothetical protein